MAGILQDLRESDIISTSTPQLMVCFLIDNSYSMLENQRMKMVNEGLKAFIDAAKSNPITRDGIEVCSITFGGLRPVVRTDFTNVSGISFRPIEAEGGTFLQKAIDLALEKISQREAFYSAAGAAYYHPWLIIMSDGKSEDNVDLQIRKLHELYDAHKLKAKCIGLGGKEEDFEELKKLSPNGEIQHMADFSMDIPHFFAMLSESATHMSMSSPDAEDDDADIFMNV